MTHPQDSLTGTFIAAADIPDTPATCYCKFMCRWIAEPDTGRKAAEVNYMPTRQS